MQSINRYDGPNQSVTTLTVASSAQLLDDCLNCVEQTMIIVIIHIILHSNKVHSFYLANDLEIVILA